MIDINKDSKGNTYIITRTDSEGFHTQINVTFNDLVVLAHKIAYRLKENALEQQKQIKVYKRLLNSKRWKLDHLELNNEPEQRVSATTKQ